jgi:NitT/TauT family transport system substrate-binding protein
MKTHLGSFAHILLASLSAVTLAASVAQAAQTNLTALKVGHLPVTGHAKFFVAKEEGFFKDEGLDVELVEFANSADGLAALRAGKLDLGAFGTTAPLVHISKGADIRIIGGVMGEDAAITVTAENAKTIKSIADLKGKKIATVRLASGDAVLRGALDDLKINWKTDVQIFELKTPAAVIEAVKSGQVDAGAVWGPHDFRAEEQGLKIIARSRTLQPGHPCCRLTVNAKDAQDRPEVWEHFIRAFLRAEKFTRDNHEKTIDDISKYLKLDRDLIAKAYYSGFLDQSSDPNVLGVEKFWNIMLKSEFVESKLDIKPFVETKLYKNALDKLAKENPTEPYWQELEKIFSERDVVKSAKALPPRGSQETEPVALAALSDIPDCH